MQVLRLVSMFSVGIMVFGTGTLFGQDFPNKPIRILTTPVGGGTDFMSRQIAQGISGHFGQPVIVDNRPTVLSREVVSKAPPDGYTLLVTGGGFWTGPLLQKTPYDPVRDFSPIALLSREIQILVVYPSLPVKSVKELIAYAKAKPGELNYSFSSVGSSTHLGVELFKQMAGVNIVGVSYKGGAAAITAVIGGESQLTINDVGLLASHVKSGKLRALAVVSPEPSALAPGLPTVSASGLPGYEGGGMTGMWAPAKTPAAIINRLNQEIARALNQPDVKERFLISGSEIVVSSPQQFAELIKSDLARMGKVIKDAGIKLD